MKPTLVLSFAAVSALGLSACAMTQATDMAPGPAAGAMSQSGLQAGTQLIATLDGEAEVPGPGDPDGNGQFASWADERLNRLCYNLVVGGIDTPVAAHIHKGAPSVAGPPVITLMAPNPQQSEACVENIEPALMADIIAQPQNYYVNVHTAPYPAGAIRARLRRQ